MPWLPLLLACAISAPANEPEKIRFEEIAAKAGVRHIHHTRKFTGKNGDVLGMFTSGGASVAVGDYDNDGFDDLFVTDSDTGQSSRLYRNNGDLTFTDVTESAGIGGGNDPHSIVSDALWFDYDNDGWRDLLVVRFGTPILYHNERNSRFRDVTQRSGLTRFVNTNAVIAFDYDNDGRLDLLFGNYFQPVNLFDLKSPKVLPNDLDHAVNGGGASLWRNNGDGSFADMTAQAGLASHTGWTLDAGHGDFNGDGFQDVYLAGDYGTDRVYFNQDVSELSGLAHYRGFWTGASWADYDRDGRVDFYVCGSVAYRFDPEFTGRSSKQYSEVIPYTLNPSSYPPERNLLFRNRGDGTFQEVSRGAGVDNPTGRSLAAAWADLDDDGWPDLYVANDISDNAMFRNLGNGKFEDISHSAWVADYRGAMGLGVGDYDGHPSGFQRGSCHG